MAQINEIIELIAAFLIFLGSIIAVISAIGIVKFQDVFTKSCIYQEFYAICLTNISGCINLLYE